jgi:hypothetical protein
VLERSMKGFDDKYTYFAHSLPGANYVVAGPAGVLLFAVRTDRGRIVVNGDRWREPFTLGRIFTIFAREGVGHPPRELEEQEKKIRELLRRAPAASTASGGENGKSLADVPIEGAALFLNEQAQLEITNPTVPVLRADQLKEYIRRKAREVKLPATTVRELTDYLRTNSKHDKEENG